jgi:hypothetical protein
LAAKKGDLILQFSECDFAAVVRLEKGQHCVVGRALVFSDHIMRKYTFKDLNQERDLELQLSKVCREVGYRDLWPDLDDKSAEYFNLQLDLVNLQLLTR